MGENKEHDVNKIRNLPVGCSCPKTKNMRLYEDATRHFVVPATENKKHKAPMF